MTSQKNPHLPWKIGLYSYYIIINISYWRATLSLHNSNVLHWTMSGNLAKYFSHPKPFHAWAYGLSDELHRSICMLMHKTALDGSGERRKHYPHQVEVSRSQEHLTGYNLMSQSRLTSLVETRRIFVSHKHLKKQFDVFGGKKNKTYKHLNLVCIFTITNILCLYLDFDICVSGNEDFAIWKKYCFKNIKRLQNIHITQGRAPDCHFW